MLQYTTECEKINESKAHTHTLARSLALTAHNEWIRLGTRKLGDQSNGSTSSQKRYEREKKTAATTTEKRELE